MAGVGSAVKEAEVLSAFQEINEDLQGKTEVVEKCESRRGGRGRAGRERGGRIGCGGWEEIMNMCWVGRLRKETRASCRRMCFEWLHKFVFFHMPSFPPSRA
jgi:hypothetical protein